MRLYEQFSNPSFKFVRVGISATFPYRVEKDGVIRGQNTRQHTKRLAQVCLRVTLIGAFVKLCRSTDLAQAIPRGPCLLVGHGISAWVRSGERIICTRYSDSMRFVLSIEVL
jgi:hypothetical protein